MIKNRPFSKVLEIASGRAVSVVDGGVLSLGLVISVIVVVA